MDARAIAYRSASEVHAHLDAGVAGRGRAGVSHSLDHPGARQSAHDDGPIATTVGVDVSSTGAPPRTACTCTI